jgi:Dyp-type peroxidase family
LTADQFTDSAFKDGLHNRSELLGDPTDRAAAGNCHQWVIGGPHNLPDLVVILASDDQDCLTETVNKLEASSNGSFRVLFQQSAAVLPPPLRGHEHFGFRDCISQPCIRGCLSDQPNAFLTPHDGNHDLIWPGEFIFGYPRQNPANQLLPGAIADAGPVWAKNGSFLVFRRLRQHVKAFQTFLQSTAQELSQRQPNLAGMTAEQFAAKLMGRWFSGTPILHAPDHDALTSAENNWFENRFAYERTLPAQSKCAVGTGDRLGLICPHAAHIRKAFPRDTTTIIGDEAENQTHRLLRRGIPFGDPVPAAGERGLLFLAYQTSIERQFEFITTNWINNPNFPDSHAGHDPIVGQNTNLKENRVRSWALPVQQPDGSVTKIFIELPTDWVIPTGGGYFFIPSISALRDLAA